MQGRGCTGKDMSMDLGQEVPLKNIKFRLYRKLLPGCPPPSQFHLARRAKIKMKIHLTSGGAVKAREVCRVHLLGHVVDLQNQVSTLVRPGAQETKVEHRTGREGPRRKEGSHKLNLKEGGVLQRKHLSGSQPKAQTGPGASWEGGSGYSELRKVRRGSGTHGESMVRSGPVFLLLLRALRCPLALIQRRFWVVYLCTGIVSATVLPD